MSPTIRGVLDSIKREVRGWSGSLTITNYHDECKTIPIDPITLYSFDSIKVTGTNGYIVWTNYFGHLFRNEISLDITRLPKC